MILRTQLATLGIDADRWFDPLDAAMAANGITNDARVAMFIAQCAHESGGFRHLVENLHYSAASLLATWPNRFTPEEAIQFAHDELRIGERAYGGRMGNGPEGSGDGFKYRGRGIIQITGRENYGRCGLALGLDLLEHPELLEEPAAACASAAWFWQTHGCNALADAGDFEGITRRINGGLNGLADRQAWLTKVYHAMGTQAPAPIEDHDSPVPQPSVTGNAPPFFQRKETGMGAGLIFGLVQALIQGFAPKAEQIVGGALEKHGFDSTVGQTIFKTIADAVAPGIMTAPPQAQIAAFAAAAKDPAIMAKAESSAVDYVTAVSPLLDKAAAYEAAARKDTRDDANDSVIRKNPALLSQRALAWMIFGAMVLVGIAMAMAMGMMWYQVFKSSDGKVDAFVASLATMAFMAITSMAQAPFRSVFGNMFDSQAATTARDTVRDTTPKRGQS